MPAGLRPKLQCFISRLLALYNRSYGVDSRDRLIWQLSPRLQMTFLEARAIAAELGQESMFADDGAFCSMLEKVS